MILAKRLTACEPLSMAAKFAGMGKKEETVAGISDEQRVPQAFVQTELRLVQLISSTASSIVSEGLNFSYFPPLDPPLY
jgi:hypothetical protein